MSQDFFYVDTPLGTLSCDAVPDDNFPSVRLYVNGVPVAILEYHGDENVLKTHTYKAVAMDDEEPTVTTLMVNKEEYFDDLPGYEQDY